MYCGCRRGCSHTRGDERGGLIGTRRSRCCVLTVRISHMTESIPACDDCRPYLKSNIGSAEFAAFSARRTFMFEFDLHDIIICVLHGCLRVEGANRRSIALKSRVLTANWSDHWSQNICCEISGWHPSVMACWMNSTMLFVPMGVEIHFFFLVFVSNL